MIFVSARTPSSQRPTAVIWGSGGWRSLPPASLSPAQAKPVPHAAKRFPLPQLPVSPGAKVEMPLPGGQSLGLSPFYPPFLARLDRGLSAFLGRPLQSFLKRVPDRVATPSAHGSVRLPYYGETHSWRYRNWPVPGLRNGCTTLVFSLQRPRPGFSLRRGLELGRRRPGDFSLRGAQGSAGSP